MVHFVLFCLAAALLIAPHGLSTVMGAFLIFMLGFDAGHRRGMHFWDDTYEEKR